MAAKREGEIEAGLVSWRTVITSIVLAGIMATLGAYTTMQTSQVGTARDIDYLKATISELRPEITRMGSQLQQSAATERAERAQLRLELRAESNQTRAEVLGELRELRAEIARKH